MTHDITHLSRMCMLTAGLLINRGDAVFSGLVPGSDIDPSILPGFNGLASGLFRADERGDIFSVVRPGDLAPGGGTFDAAFHGSINDAGDIAC